MQNANKHNEDSELKRLTKKHSTPKIINIDKVKALIRNSSRERIHELAKLCKDNKEQVISRVPSIMNFKQL